MIKTPVRNVLDEVTDFLATAPTDEQLLSYRFSDDLQQRLHHLLDLNGEGELNDREMRELEDYQRANRMMASLKVRTRLRARGIHQSADYRPDEHWAVEDASMIRIPKRDVFAVVTDFLASRPSDEDLLSYSLPDDMQERLHYLLDLNGEGELNDREEQELEDYIRVDHMVSQLKSESRLRTSALADVHHG